MQATLHPMQALGSTESHAGNTSSHAGSTESPLHHLPSKSSTPNTTSAGLVFYSSATAQMASSAAGQVFPVHLVNAGAVNVVPVPLLQHCVYPSAVGSPPVVHSPWLAASAAGTQVSSLSEYQSLLIAVLEFKLLKINESFEI